MSETPKYSEPNIEKGIDFINTLSADFYMSNTPFHYVMKIQPVEFIVANDIPFIEANIIKYVCRHKDKDGVNDLLKAAHYLDMLIKQYLPEQNGSSK